MRDAGHRTPDIEQRMAEKAKIIYPPPRGGGHNNLTLFFMSNETPMPIFIYVQSSIVKTEGVLFMDNSSISTAKKDWSKFRFCIALHKRGFLFFDHSFKSRLMSLLAKGFF